MTVVRFFNTVGPGQTGRYGMVVPRFVRAALQGQPIPVYGDGNQSRCFCHVRDTVRAVIDPVSYTHLRAHETVLDLVCRLLLEKKNKTTSTTPNHLYINYQ